MKRSTPQLVVFVYDRSTSISGHQLELARQLTNERIRKLDHGDRIAAHQLLQKLTDAVVASLDAQIEAGVQAVKLEGGARVLPQVEMLVSAGIPVMAHLGLTRAWFVRRYLMPLWRGQRGIRLGDDGAVVEKVLDVIKQLGSGSTIIARQLQCGLDA